MHGSIYLVQDAGSLVAMTEQPYAVEDVLQRLLADYPSLLAGDQMDSVAPRQWVLVRREAGIPSEEGGAGRWALDHLFLDQDAVPTFVEVKRSVDTRIRREVVGQMLDYAANAVVYWSAEVLRAQFEAACEAEGRDPVTAFADAFGPTVDPETFWANAKRNLQAGKVRLVFVADVIPPELLRVVEFLNGQMNPAEVLAVEIKQFVGQGLQALVPRVVGQTEAARDAKTSTGGGQTGTQWDEASFFRALGERRGAAEAVAGQKILAWARAAGLRIWWGKGKQDGSFFPMLDHGGVQHWLVSVWTYGSVEVQFGMMSKQPPFADEAKRLELLRRLNGIAGIALPADGITRRPTFRLSVLVAEPALKAFLDVLEWVVQEDKTASV